MAWNRAIAVALTLASGMIAGTGSAAFAADEWSVQVENATISPQPDFRVYQNAYASAFSRNVGVSMPREIGQYASVSMRGYACSESQAETAWECGDTTQRDAQIIITYAGTLADIPAGAYSVTLSALDYLPGSTDEGKTVTVTGTVTVRALPTVDLALTAFAPDERGREAGSARLYVTVANRGPAKLSEGAATLTIKGVAGLRLAYVDPTCQRQTDDVLRCQLAEQASGKSLLYGIEVTGPGWRTHTFTASVTVRVNDPRKGNNAITAGPWRSGGGGSGGSSTATSAARPTASAAMTAPDSPTPVTTMPAAQTAPEADPTLDPLAGDAQTQGDTPWTWLLVVAGVVVLLAAAAGGYLVVRRSRSG